MVPDLGWIRSTGLGRARRDYASGTPVAPRPAQRRCIGPSGRSRQIRSSPLTATDPSPIVTRAVFVAAGAGETIRTHAGTGGRSSPLPPRNLVETAACEALSLRAPLPITHCKSDRFECIRPARGARRKSALNPATSRLSDTAGSAMPSRNQRLTEDDDPEAAHARPLGGLAREATSSRRMR